MASLEQQTRVDNPQDKVSVPLELRESDAQLNNLSDARESLKEENIKDAQTISHIINMTTLARLSGNRNLDNLFDWEADLWWEETLALYSIIEMLNGSNYISGLKAPVSIDLDITPFKQNYSYDISYDQVVQSDGKKVKRVREIVWDGTLPMNTTTIIFHYATQNSTQIERIHFQRPFNLNEGGGSWMDQEIKLERDTQWRTNYITVGKPLEINNKLTIRYDDEWRVWEVKQTKLWISEDTTRFGYDIKTWELKVITYGPGFSLKRTGKTMKKAEEPTMLLYWIAASIENIKKVKWLDVFEIENNNLGVPTNIRTNLWASRWVYKWEQRSFVTDDKWFIQSGTSEQSKIGFDRHIQTTIRYETKK